MTDRDRTAGEESVFAELGATGLHRIGGVVTEEFLNELRWDRRWREIKRMSENDAIVGGVLLMIEMIARSVDWRVDPAGDEPEQLEAAEHIETSLLDMSSSWEETLAEILSFLPFGFSVHEIVYKRRLGPDPGTFTDSTGKTRDLPISDYDDGRIGWRKLPIRAQESIEWIFDEAGGIDGVDQLTEMGERALIPIEKLALFRTSARKNNPEGRSILRRAWRAWKFKTRIEEIEAIGIERDLAGFPIGKVPARWFTAKATAEERTALEQWKQTVRDLRRDSLEGVVIPQATDENGVALYGLELLTTGGTRQINVGEVIARKNQEIATAMLADFIVLGHENVGSFALSKTKTELFYVALGAFLDQIADVFNRHLIPRLLRLNGYEGPYPRLAHSKLEHVDLEILGKYVAALSGVGYPLFPNELLEDRLAEVAGFPPPVRDDDGIDRTTPPEPTPPGEPAVIEPPEEEETET